MDLATRNISRTDYTTDIGANPSAEDADEGADDQAQTVIDVVHSFRLNETSFDKKQYLTHLKGVFLGRCTLSAVDSL